MTQVATDVGLMWYPAGDGGVTTIVQRDGYWEKPEGDALRENIRRTDSFVDVGAHVGYFTRLAKLCGALCISAYEPMRSNYELLRKNMPQHASAKMYAIGNMTADDVRLYVSLVNSGDNRLVTFPEATGYQSVAMRRLDRLHRKIDVLKIDTQGDDIDVLRGLGDLRPRVIVCEVWPEGRGHEAPIHEWADAGGYDVQELPGRERGYWSVVMTR